MLDIDFETRSELDLKKVGVYRYVTHPSTEVLVMAWALPEDEEVSVWVPGEEIPPALLTYVLEGGGIRAHNAMFERLVWNYILVPRHDFPETPNEQFWDTAAQAAAMGLPRALGNLAKVLGVEEVKDDEGRRLMLKMTKPRKPTKKDSSRWVDGPEERARLAEYAKNDVRTERAVAPYLRPLSDEERAVYLHDQLINDRGIRIDVALVSAAQEIANEELAAINAQLVELTNGEVESVSQRERLQRWLNEAGLDIADLRKNTVRDTLDTLTEDTADEIRRVLQLRAEGGRTSLGKLDKMLTVPSGGDRARGLVLYHGAGTGRFSAKLIQPHNFPRGTVKNVEQYIPAIMAGTPEQIDAPILEVISSMLRSMIIAQPGGRLRGGDFAQIEARVLAWLAEQNDLVELFATGGKVYETMAAHIYGVPLESIANPSEERTIGKNTVLGAGFQMGWKKYQSQIQVQTGIEISDEDSKRAVYGYRELYYHIPEYWEASERAVIQAVAEPGSVVSIGRGGAVRYTYRGGYLWCILPSGRPLAYPRARLAKKETPWGEEKLGVSFETTNSFTHKWGREHLYGGRLTENVVQAIARDIMVASMARVEEAGYPVVLTVHDEVLADSPAGQGTLEEYLTLMKERPEWADGLPVSVEGWEGERYRK